MKKWNNRVWRYYILVDGNKYSKNFLCDTSEDEVGESAEHAYRSGLTTMRVLITFLCLIVCVNLNARAKYGNSEKNGFEAVGFIGLKIIPLKDAFMLGAETEFGFSVFRGCFLGLCGDRSQGNTKNSFGFHPPDLSGYHITSSSFGLNLKYRIFHNSNSGFFVRCSYGWEDIQLGDYNLYNVVLENAPIISYYHTVSMNNYRSFRPGVEYYLVKRIIFSANYNFLSGDSNFGKISDFQGLQVTVNLVIKGKRKYGYGNYLYY